MKLSLRRQIPLAFVIALILLVVIGLFSYRNTASLNETINWEKHTQQIIMRLDETLVAVVDGETGTRGFMITRDESFLEPYNSAGQRIETNLVELRRLLADNPAQAEKLPELEKLIRDKFSIMNFTIEKRRTQSMESVLAQLPGSPGKHLMEQIRTLIGQLKSEESRLLAMREAELDQNIRGTYRILILGSLAGILSLGLANFAIFREIGRRQSAEQKLVDVNKQLETRVADRTKALAASNEELKSEIAQREKFEAGLQASESFKRTILDSLPAHIAVINNTGEIIAVNNAWEGFAQQNCVEECIATTGVGQSYLEVCRKAAAFDEDTKFVLENIEAVLAGGKDEFTFEYPCHSPEIERWFILQVNPLKSDVGGAVISHIDITDRKRAEVQLKISEEFNRSIFENSPDCIKVMDAEGNLHSMNTNGLCLMEIEDFDQFIGKKWSDFWLDEENELAYQAVETARKGETAHFEGFCRTAKGTPKWWDVTVAPIFDGEGKTVRLVSTSRDVTERNKAEQEREELLKRERVARKDAEIANRLRDEFLATVSHELRAPLNSILGWSRLMQQGKLDEPTTEKALETIVRNAEAQNRLIEDLLDVSRIISGKLRLEVITINPSSFVEPALETVRPAAEAKNIKLEVKEDTGISHISGDPNRLQQVVWNLLSNAIKFTPPDGKVSVSVERDDSHVEIRVKDSGVGIKEEFLPYVFDRFRQADATSIRKFGGLGLGLAIVRHLTEMHGGTVEAYSEGENKGSTFVVRLPLLTASTEETDDDSSGNRINMDAETSFSLDGLLILAVDDEEDTRQLLVQTLTHYGATVTTASSAAEALSELVAKNPDILVSDIGMPEEDGYSLIRRARAQNIKIPAIALTAFTRAQDRMRALSSGFQNHVSKPVEPDELATVIASLTGRLKMNDEIV